MKLKIDDKEYSIKFGYKPTLKERIISRVAKISDISDENEEINTEKLEDLLMFLPELLLVGLQVHHKDFRYDIDTGEGKEKQLEKTFSLVEKYMESEEADVMVFFSTLQEALLEDSFLSSLFKKEMSKEESRKQNK